MIVNFAFFVLCWPWLSVASKGSNRCSKENSIPCAADEYLDTTTCLCSSCADICQLRPDKSTDSSCQYNCPDYKRTNLPRHSLSTKESGLGSTSVALVQVQEDNALVKKPLFWTSVVSVFISVVATIILIVLCTCKKSRPVLAFHRIRRMPASQTRMPSQGENEKNESSTGMLRAEEDANDPLLSSAKNFSKEKCGETFAPLVSHRVSLDSCAVVHETIVSRCESSCLHKPCVASFKDSGFLVNSEKLCIFSLDYHDRTTASASVMLGTATNAVTCTDTSTRTTNSRRQENLDSSLCVKGFEKPSEAIERCAFESGFFNSDSCTGATTWREEPPVGYTVYTVSVASGVATDKVVEMPSSYPVQETYTWKDEGSNAADWKCFMEILPASYNGIESKSPNNKLWSLDKGVKPSLLTSLHGVLDESALQESSDETGLKKMRPDTNCTLNCTEYICSPSHSGRSCDRHIHARYPSVGELEELGDGKQLSELNLKIRSSANTPAAKSQPSLFNLEVRNGGRHEEEESNEEDTTLKMQKRNTYPKSRKAENLFDVNCVSYMDM